MSGCSGKQDRQSKFDLCSINATTVVKVQLVKHLIAEAADFVMDKISGIFKLFAAQGLFVVILDVELV